MKLISEHERARLLRKGLEAAQRMSKILIECRMKHEQALAKTHKSAA